MRDLDGRKARQSHGFPMGYTIECISAPDRSAGGLIQTSRKSTKTDISILAPLT